MSSKKKIAVVLAGCGVYDGAEIHEAVFTLYAIEQLNLTYQIFAPDISQYHVINHTDGSEMNENRNVLIEAARIARGNIKSTTELKSDNFDAIIFPGGFGVAKNLCTFAIDGTDCNVNNEISSIVKSFHSQNKPIGALCISPALIVKILKTGNVTIGADEGTAEAITKMGGIHSITTHTKVIVDAKNKILTTPCYMLDATISQIALSAQNLVKELSKLL